MGELKIAYSDKKVTPWGGMKLLKNFIDHLERLSYLGKNLQMGFFPYAI